mmetsp:Transcript_28064/g.43391  ORF Transcript_28064/g.43391 Transcript_28064/m.43391 type:complete len:155 (+) Transcript_28064:195-659(+)
MPTPAKTADSGKKRGRSPKSASPEKKTSSSPIKKRGRPPKPLPNSSLPSPIKRPRGRPPKKEATTAPVSLFDPRLPPPPPPPPPVNNPFYQKFVMEYWQNNYFYNQQVTGASAVMNIPGIIGSPMPSVAAANLDGKGPAALKSDAGDDVESTSV